jgi:glycine/D-amino acid oxidase-like deaminating enzyme/nitrite reductase/ring-hydroxylating ferredoxin subunit
MNRDGQNISLWQNEMPSFISNEKFPEDAEVVIIGGGITGISIALELQLAGKKCVVLEAQNVGFGTTSGTSAHLNTLMDTPYYKIKNDFNETTAQNVAHLTQNAIKLIEENIRRHGIECGFERKTAYLFSQDKKQSEELEKIIEGTKEVDIEAEFTSSLPIPIPFEKVARIEDQAQFHPTQYLYGIAQAFQLGGGNIIQNCLVTDIVIEKGQTLVVTSKGKIRTSYAVYATHIPPGINVLHFRCAPYRSYVLALKLKNDNYPHALIYDLQDPYHYYRTQEVNGQKYLIVGGEDHKTGHESNTEHCFLRLESHVRNYFDVESVAFRWSSQYFESADGLPYVGHLPFNPKNIFVATGFGGNGMIYGTASALVLTDIIGNGSTKYQDLFNPGRIKPVAGFSNFIKEAADVTSVFIGKKFDAEKIESAAGIAKGEARVVQYEGASIALYKDEKGKLHAVNPTCPHIKCNVGWNNSEKSWDCPCHGSRFSYTGELLSAPARKNLERVCLWNEDHHKVGDPV